MSVKTDLILTGENCGPLAVLLNQFLLAHDFPTLWEVPQHENDGSRSANLIFVAEVYGLSEQHLSEMVWICAAQRCESCRFLTRQGGEAVSYFQQFPLPLRAVRVVNRLRTYA